MISTYVVIVLPSAIQGVVLLLLLVALAFNWQERRRFRKLSEELKKIVEIAHLQTIAVTDDSEHP